MFFHLSFFFSAFKQLFLPAVIWENLFRVLHLGKILQGGKFTSWFTNSCDIDTSSLYKTHALLCLNEHLMAWYQFCLVRSHKSENKLWIITAYLEQIQSIPIWKKGSAWQRCRCERSYDEWYCWVFRGVGRSVDSMQFGVPATQE